MFSPPHRLVVIDLLFSALLIACSPSNEPPQSLAPSVNTAAPAANAQVVKELTMYEDLRRAQSYELALPIGEEIIQRFPTSAAAAQVQQSLAEVETKAVTLSEKRRLERLWSYQSGKESGGMQNTASIYSGKANAENEPVRLVLRRHSAWGQSTYLFADVTGFECGKNCTLTMRFDDQPLQRVKAKLPETGEPAIFIEDDRAFIAKLEKAHTITIEVMLKGKGRRTLKFEVGGYTAEKFPAHIASG